MQTTLSILFFLPQWLGFLSNPETTQMSINKDDSSVRCSVLKEDAKVKPNDEKYYHWYKAYSIQKSRAGYSGKLLHGSYVSYYLSKGLYEQGQFKQGLKHGYWKEWYATGELKTKAQYRNGFLHGTVLQFHKNGELQKQEHYKKNELHGKQTTFLADTAITVKYKKGEKVEPKIKTPKPEKIKPKRIKPGKQKQEKKAPKKPKKEKKSAEDKEAISKKD